MKLKEEKTSVYLGGTSKKVSISPVLVMMKGDHKGRQDSTYHYGRDSKESFIFCKCAPEW